VFAGGSATADKIARVQKKIDEVVGAVSDIKVRLQEVPYEELKAWLGKDATRRMEKQWGELERFSGLGTPAQKQVSYFILSLCRCSKST
jgi:hypothetical protein